MFNIAQNGKLIIVGANLLFVINFGNCSILHSQLGEGRRSITAERVLGAALEDFGPHCGTSNGQPFPPIPRCAASFPVLHGRDPVADEVPSGSLTFWLDNGYFAFNSRGLDVGA